MSWTELPQGKDVTFTAGWYYEATATVKASISQADLTAYAAKHGLVVTSYVAVPSPGDDSYNFVTLQGHAASSGTIPWSASFPASLVVGSSTALHVWESPTPGAPPPPPVVPPDPTVPLLAASVTTLVLIIGWFTEGRP